ncbi:DUF4377 domain-containing protein [Pollutimonas harenae]|uniref:META and DUF4377 domain-containing protein n=1 Tax=Pollutimonas harenae TaxID=657015 RepID=A0A853HAI6_9BURK|nr:DUF4377 domain-containing protein [Pollutimonas harenae]NYT87014.1 META and DUF4377 domain-containing protein [Pollutimonas harenae]TEA69234.1 DUF4377 domain-containing protein [Pollutimonas harenae]
MKKALSVIAGVAILMALGACTALQSNPGTSARQYPMNTEATLQAYHWTLQTIAANGLAHEAAPTGLNSKPLILNFSGQRISIDGLCNALNGDYTINEFHIQITHLVSTMKTCANEQLMRYEHEVAQRLPTATHWSLQNASSASPALALTFKDGTAWKLTGKPTAATRYGGKPQRIFLEVAPQRVTCTHALIPNHQCLKVREITYDDQGLKTDTGEWTYYYDTIEGYEHQPGVRNILRINRYTQKTPPADASSHVDILDMIIESETI